jgi:hypothetical protein
LFVSAVGRGQNEPAFGFLFGPPLGQAGHAHIRKSG